MTIHYLESGTVSSQISNKPVILLIVGALNANHEEKAIKEGTIPYLKDIKELMNKKISRSHI